MQQYALVAAAQARLAAAGGPVLCHAWCADVGDQGMQHYQDGLLRTFPVVCCFRPLPLLPTQPQPAPPPCARCWRGTLRASGRQQQQVVPAPASCTRQTGWPTSYTVCDWLQHLHTARLMQGIVLYIDWQTKYQHGALRVLRPFEW